MPSAGLISKALFVKRYSTRWFAIHRFGFCSTCKYNFVVHVQLKTNLPTQTSMAFLKKLKDKGVCPWRSN
jgi:hypothetical protein